MSANRNYENARIVLFESDDDARQTIKSTLVQDTFTQTLATPKLQTAQSAIINDEADLMIVDIDQKSDNVCHMMRKIRHHQIGENPFQVSIAISNCSSFKRVRLAVNSGFDVLLLKPFSMATFLGRVHHLMHHRSPFAITSDYIGPDRRISKRPQTPRETDTLMTVPNPLAIMAGGNISVPLLRQSIKSSITRVNERRVQANAEKASAVIEEMASRYMLGKLDHKFVQNIEMINSIGMDMHQRLKRSKFAHVAELSDTMCSVVSKVLDNPTKPVAKDIELLQYLGNAIDRAFRGEASEIMAARTISDSIRATA